MMTITNNSTVSKNNNDCDYITKNQMTVPMMITMIINNMYYLPR